MTPTIHDVAASAGCSIKTVSRVLNDQAHVRPALRARVHAAINEIGYTPNILARRFVQRRPGTLGFVTSALDADTSPSVLASALTLSQAAGYDLLLQVLSNQSADRDHLVNMVTGKRLEGLVVAPPCDVDPILVALLAENNLPRVYIDPLDPAKSYPFVCIDDRYGARELTTHLLDAGHRRIAFLKGAANLRTSSERLEGYTQALAQRGIALDPRLTAGSEGTHDGGYNTVRIFLSEGARPSAFFAVNDQAALGALFALQEMGVRVPREISVCGYGDTPASAQVFPGLTTVRRPTGDLLASAIRVLIDHLAGETEAQSITPLLPSLVLRGSSGQIPGG